MMDERERILDDVRRWVRQQRRDGAERLVLSPAGADAPAASEPAPPAGDPPAAAAAKAEAAPVAADGPRTVEAFNLELGLTAEPVERPDLTDEQWAILEERHPQWRGTPLMDLAGQISVCERCGLARGRRNAVPGTGHPRAKLVFIGEAPGAEEDRQGIPFVGRAGKLLDKILAAIDLGREDVQILNILKCRPPENRNPAPDEILACRPYLERQIELIGPGIIVGLGLFAGQWLTGRRVSLTKLRETGPFAYRGVPVYVTYHPAALLRNPNWKRPAWEDFQRIRQEYDRL